MAQEDSEGWGSITSSCCPCLAGATLGRNPSQSLTPAGFSALKQSAPRWCCHFPPSAEARSSKGRGYGRVFLKTEGQAVLSPLAGSRRGRPQAGSEDLGTSHQVSLHSPPPAPSLESESVPLAPTLVPQGASHGPLTSSLTRPLSPLGPRPDQGGAHMPASMPFPLVNWDCTSPRSKHVMHPHYNRRNTGQRSKQSLLVLAGISEPRQLVSSCWCCDEPKAAARPRLLILYVFTGLSSLEPDNSAQRQPLLNSKRGSVGVRDGSRPLHPKTSFVK